MILGKTRLINRYALQTKDGQQVYRNGTYSLSDHLAIPVLSFDAPCGHYARQVALKAKSALGQDCRWVHDGQIETLA